MSDAPTLDQAPDQAPGHSAAPRLPPAERHSCFLLYPIPGLTWPPPAGLTLGTLADAQGGAAERAWLPADALATIAGERRDRPVWEPGTLNPGPDLLPYIRRLLGEDEARTPAAADQPAPDPKQPPLGRVLRLAESARKLIQGECLAYAKETPKEERRPKRLCLLLSIAARARIARRAPDVAGDALTVEVLDVHQIALRTGYGFLMVEVQFASAGGAGLDPYLIVEGLYSLARINRLTWRRGDGGALGDAPTFALGHLVRSLIGRDDGGRQVERVFSATCLQFRAAPNPAALSRLLTQLARHYTDDYQTQDPVPGCVSFLPFRNIAHRFALEGCATAVDLSGYAPDPAPDLLEHYQTGSYRRHYLPIVLLACHEFSFLLHATDRAAVWPDPGDEADAITRMRATREAVTRFMLCFRHSNVSRISMHNEVNRALRQALGLDRMLTELDRDSAQIDAHLGQVAAAQAADLARRHARRFHWASVIGAGGIGWLISFTIFKEVLEIEPVRDLLHLAHDRVHLTAAGVALGIAAISAVLTGIGGPRGSGHGGGGHAARELSIHEGQR